MGSSRRLLFGRARRMSTPCGVRSSAGRSGYEFRHDKSLHSRRLAVGRQAESVSDLTHSLAKVLRAAQSRGGGFRRSDASSSRRKRRLRQPARRSSRTPRTRRGPGPLPRSLSRPASGPRGRSRSTGAGSAGPPRRCAPNERPIHGGDVVPEEQEHLEQRRGARALPHSVRQLVVRIDGAERLAQTPPMFGNA